MSSANISEATEAAAFNTRRLYKMKQIPCHDPQGYPQGIVTNTNDVPALQGKLVKELQRHVVKLLGHLPVQLLQPFGLSPYPRKDNLTMSAEC